MNERWSGEWTISSVGLSIIPLSGILPAFCGRVERVSKAQRHSKRVWDVPKLQGKSAGHSRGVMNCPGVWAISFSMCMHDCLACVNIFKIWRYLFSCFTGQTSAWERSPRTQNHLGRFLAPTKGTWFTLKTHRLLGRKPRPFGIIAEF